METVSKPLGGLGASEIGALFTQQGLKAKTAQSLAYEKALEIINGVKRDITTAAMQHGLFNEEEAFNTIIAPNFPSAVYQSNISLQIKGDLWATPDVIDGENEVVMDIKCPYTIYSFFENIRKPKDYYLAQSQMQMLATGFKTGYLVFFLTSNVTDSFGNKIEYEISADKRHKFIEISADEDFHEEILKRADSFFEMRDLILKDLLEAPEISDEEYFQLAMSDHKITRFKDKSNLLTWKGKIYNNIREGYIIIE